MFISSTVCIIFTDFSSSGYDPLRDNVVHMYPDLTLHFVSFIVYVKWPMNREILENIYVYAQCVGVGNGHVNHHRCVVLRERYLSSFAAMLGVSLAGAPASIFKLQMLRASLIGQKASPTVTQVPPQSSDGLAPLGAPLSVDVPRTAVHSPIAGASHWRAMRAQEIRHKMSASPQSLGKMGNQACVHFPRLR